MSTGELVPPREWRGAPDDLVRTEGGQRLHVPACPHLASDVRTATEDERAEMPVCTWCRAELDGNGRTYLKDLADAVQRFGVPVANQERVMAAMRGVEHDSLWMPNSRSYVALGRDGQARAWFGKTYAQPSRDEVVGFPDYVAGGRDGSRGGDALRGDVCPEHFIERPVTGSCEQCD